MSLIDKFGQIAGRVGERVQSRVGDLVEDALLSEGVRSSLQAAESAMREARWDDALTALDRAEAAKPGLTRIELLKGMVYLELDRTTRAIFHLEKATKIRESVDSVYFLGLAYERAGRWVDARKALLAATKIEREPHLLFDILVALGRIYLAMGRHEKAAHELRRALELRPAEPDAITLLAAALRRSEKSRESLELLRVHRAMLNDAASWVLLGQLELSFDHLEEARAAFEQALQRGAGVEAYEGAACAAFEADAVEICQSLLERAGAAVDGSPVLLAVSARLAQQRGELALAAQLFGRALEGSPKLRAALLGAGEIALEADDGHSAEGYFARVLEEDPDDSTALRGCGRARLLKGDRAGALRYLGRARSELQEPKVLLALATIASGAGDLFEARSLLEEARTTTPSVELSARIEAAIAEVEQSVSPQFDAEALRTLDSRRLRELALAVREHVAQVPALVSYMPAANALAEDLDSPLKVAIVGEFNAGKSTLVNAYLGEPIVATGVLPTTAHINVLRYGPRRVARIIEADGEGFAEIPFSELSSALDAAGSAVDHIELHTPHPDLRAVHFLDTPGFNAAVDEHEDLAARAAREADAVIWLIDSSQAWTESQRLALAHTDESKEKVIVVLNKRDALDEREQAETLKYVEEKLGPQVRAIVSMSALDAFKERDQARRESRAESVELLQQAGWSAFTDALHRELLDRITRLKCLKAARKLRQLSAEVLEQSERDSRRYRLLSEQMKEGAQALERSRDQIRRRVLPEAWENFEEQRRSTLAKVAKEVEDVRRPSAGWFSTLELAQEDMGFILDLLGSGLRRDLKLLQTKALEAAVEPVEATLHTLEWVGKALSSRRARDLFRRIEQFVSEERLLRSQLGERVFAAHLAWIDGRLSVADTVPGLARRLGDVSSTLAERQEVLASVAGEFGERVVDELRSWNEEYFDVALRLCENVRRDISRWQFETELVIRKPFELFVHDLVPDV